MRASQATRARYPIKLGSSHGVMARRRGLGLGTRPANTSTTLLPVLLAQAERWPMDSLVFPARPAEPVPRPLTHVVHAPSVVELAQNSDATLIAQKQVQTQS
jgi:hypothetical protein